MTETNEKKKQGGKTTGKSGLMKRLWLVLIIAVVIGVAGLSVYSWKRFGRADESSSALGAFAASRGDLIITGPASG